MNTLSSKILTLGVGTIVSTLGISLAQAQESAYLESYSIEDIALPKNAPPEIGAVKLDKNGHLYVALRRGDVIYAKPVDDAKAFDWKLFASGFHNPCGMEILDNGTLLVSQMGELTEVKDTDKDGKADEYNNLCSGWGVSGNYHETNEICPDGEGGYFLAIGTASYNGPTFHNVRGEYSKIGRRGRNFASVKWKGWVMQYTKDGELKPFAKGFRMHNGICRDKEGNIWATDNEGDWRATTPLYHVEKGNFYGHPSSLVWDPQWPEEKDPLKMPLEEIDKMRTRAAVLLPHGSVCRSASEPIQIPANFGPFEGQLLIPDNNSRKIARVMLDKVNGKYQGACTHFIKTDKLRSGGNRVVFADDGKTLYLGHTVRGWGKLGEGLTRIKFKDVTPFDVHTIKLTKKGFDLNFTEKIDASKATSKLISVKSYVYKDTWKYGGKPQDVSEETVSNLKATGEKSISMEIKKLRPGRVYEINFSQGDPLFCARGKRLANKTFYYTANELIGQ